MQAQVILVHYGELWLRGKNKQRYIHQLKANLNSLLEGEAYSIEEEHDRIILRPSSEASANNILKKLGYLFGISSFNLAYEAEPNIDSITSVAKELLLSRGYKKIKILAHRSYKELSFNSLDIINEVSKVAKSIGVEPSLHEYDGTLFINVTKKHAYIYDKNIKGLGGLPVGTSGKGVILLSGGIDSPVSAWFAMKRGVLPIYLHVHQFADPEMLKESKIPMILSKLSLYSKGLKPIIYYIPAHYFTVAVAKADKQGRYSHVLFKAFLFKLAEIVAKKEGAKLIFTGESLGQVSSQTPSNIAASEANVNMPILRPLIGFDKEEIISIARKIGTYELSIKPYPDVCVINARKPSTNADIKIIKELLKEMHINEIARKSISEALVLPVEERGE